MRLLTLSLQTPSEVVFTTPRTALLDKAPRDLAVDQLKPYCIRDGHVMTPLSCPDFEVSLFAAAGKTCWRASRMPTRSSLRETLRE